MLFLEVLLKFKTSSKTNFGDAKSILIAKLILLQNSKISKSFSKILIFKAHSAPLQDSSIYGDERWTVARDGEGRMHLVDLNPLEVEPESFFDPGADIFYLLYTRSNPTEGQRITYDVQSLTNFRINGNTRVLIHGWTTSAVTIENIFTRNEFLAYGDYNVIGK